MRGSRPGHETWLPVGRSLPRASRHVSAAAATLLVLCAIAAALGPGARWVRALEGVGFVALAGAVSRTLGRRLQPLHQPPHGWLLVDDGGLHRVDRATRITLVEWAEPFGVTVLASADRATILIAVTSPGATRYIPATVRDAEDASAAVTILERATTAAACDLREGDDAALSAGDAEKLLAAIGRHAAAALDRVYLSDASGHAVVLDRSELRVGTRRIDLSAPLEWRASLFQERGVLTASICQATWVRQGEVEIILVSPLAADGTWMGDANVAVRAAGRGPAAKRAVAHDFYASPRPWRGSRPRATRATPSIASSCCPCDARSTVRREPPGWWRHPRGRGRRVGHSVPSGKFVGNCCHSELGNCCHPERSEGPHSGNMAGFRPMGRGWSNARRTSCTSSRVCR